MSNVLRVALWVCAVAALVGGAFALWPVCVPLSSEQVTAFQPPISERNDTYLFGPMFQQDAGQWYQCKTRIARALFF
ncbi:MAG: hypothetical protein A2W72_15875 [Burkholderiales bacterium RIFCSPLOWO2_12_67_14]|jgi:hypothetical protein|nr:MAG: hypothetical protein A3I64_23845 [Burkholderiales bacterium RIFCSPLOWO2_02_FULL_67_64]OGB46356.1 MAG: hypothetical protein A3E51_23035 [Burkholderiales bacterium RIFCSPHIGHO2_12_FULL_67_38]OGB49033.1 MAG: hypothetical protein A2W72_15875 [Burkholderiales bacterium RIFCSPLOWO2_12_67_14]